MATRIPQSPKTHLEKIIADADLDALGRDDFWELNRCLRAEQAAFGNSFSDLEWDRDQLKFMLAHHYFTKAAIDLRENRKQEYISELQIKISSSSAYFSRATVVSK